jgi:hypothetical protein
MKSSTVTQSLPSASRRPRPTAARRQIALSLALVSGAMLDRNRNRDLGTAHRKFRRPRSPTVGLTGVISHSVGRRTTEIGVRMALAASRASVLAMVLEQAMTLVGAGLAVGLFAAVAGIAAPC